MCRIGLNGMLVTYRSANELHNKISNMKPYKGSVKQTLFSYLNQANKAKKTI